MNLRPFMLDWQDNLFGFDASSQIFHLSLASSEHDRSKQWLRNETKSESFFKGAPMKVAQRIQHQSPIAQRIEGTLSPKHYSSFTFLTQMFRKDGNALAKT
jgi:hypothetical protein